MNEKDEILAGYLIKDNHEAFTELYVRYHDKLYNFCYKFIHSKEETEDIIQEIFFKLWTNRKEINTSLSFSSYLYTITYNKIKNYFLHLNVEYKIKTYLADIENNISNTIDNKLLYTEYQRLLRQAINELPPQRQRIFKLSWENNLSHKEIAEQLGVSINTVQQHISLSLKFIRHFFNKNAELNWIVILFLSIYK